MTTAYAQSIHAKARREVQSSGFIREATWHALRNLGYSEEAIAGLERDLKDRPQ